jgi:hypothetical protein
MRVVKLSAGEFTDEAAVDAFFTAELPLRDPAGLFLFRRQIAADGLAPGETLLFTHGGRLRFVGRAESGRQDNSFMKQAEYPNCFIVEPGSIRRADATLAELEQALNAAGAGTSLAGRAWTRVPDSVAVERVVAELAGGTPTATQRCPICSAAVAPNSRYPRYVCGACADKASAEDGRPLQFSNVDISGGFTAEYADTGETYASHECFIGGIACYADEARFGGIVIETAG